MHEGHRRPLTENEVDPVRDPADGIVRSPIRTIPTLSQHQMEDPLPAGNQKIRRTVGGLHEGELGGSVALKGGHVEAVGNVEANPSAVTTDGEGASGHFTPYSAL